MLVNEFSNSFCIEPLKLDIINTGNDLAIPKGIIDIGLRLSEIVLKLYIRLRNNDMLGFDFLGNINCEFETYLRGR